MKTKIIVASLFLAAGAVTAWKLTQQPSFDVEMQSLRAGPYSVRIGIDPPTPRVGENRLVIELADESGQPVTDASIEAFAEMPAMGTMAAMRAPADLREVSPGRYTGPMNLGMRGSWPLTVRIAADGLGEAGLAFDMSTASGGLSLTSGGDALTAPMGMSAPNKYPSQEYASGETRYTCPMHPSVQHSEPGQCPICGMNLVPASSDEPDAESGMPGATQHPAGDANSRPAMAHDHAHGPMHRPVDGGVSHYTCSMHPSVKSPQPGQCPICGMDLTPVTNEELQSGTITLDARRRQLIGVTTAPARRQLLTREIRAVGTVTFDETRLADVNLKFDAWIGELKANATGIQVTKGDPLFTVYGPDLLAAQDEYLETRRRSRSPKLIAAARKRLGLWDIADAAIAELERRGQALDFLPITAPISGIVIDKPVVEGGAMKAGHRMMRIANLSSVWIDAQIFEADLALVQSGMAARVRLPYLPDRDFQATVDYVYPYLEGRTRTGRVRLVLDNPEGLLKPEMYAEVHLAAELGERLVVPEVAVLYAGESRVVFVDRGEGRLEPRRIRIGQRNRDFIEVLAGIAPGESVVTSGNFLVAAETRLKAGIKQW